MADDLDNPVDLPSPHSEQRFAIATELLQKHFGFQSFRRHQEQVIRAVLDGHDCLAVLPTGSGKSLCYAIPGLLQDGLSIVVSPLVALMREQVSRYRALGLPCASFDGQQQSEERQYVHDLVADGRLKLLFVSPEKLAQPAFRQRMQESSNLKVVAVDEAHCVSQWGGNFRPDYRKIGFFMRDFLSVQKIALTATATASVRSDIIQSLGLVEPRIVTADPLRENLHIKVFRFKKMDQQLTSLLNAAKNESGVGIVYASTRKSCEELFRMLEVAGEAVSIYHGGMNPDAREMHRMSFEKNKTRIMVATNAFGLGIDRADVSFIFHCGMPSSLEAYLQEIGRAGRDGSPAKCWMFFCGRDYHVQKFLIEKSFPDKKLLKNFWETLLKQPAILSEAGVDRDQKVMIELLSREGLISKKFDYYGQNSYLPVSDSFLVEEFFSEYAKRRQEHVAKLKAMSQFVESGEDGVGLLRHYFGL